MAPITNSCVIFNEIPEGYPEPGKTTVYNTSQTIDLETVPLNGGYLVKSLAISIDPFMRGRMRDPSITSYAPPFYVGHPIDNFGVGVVLRSESSEFKAGDHVYGFIPFVEYFVRTPTDGFPPYELLKNEANLPWSTFVGAAGMPSQTAHYGWWEHANAKKGDVVFVTAGAGPVGSTVIQLAKAEGLKVIASAGTPEKIAWMKECGADVVFNYKTTSTQEVLEKEGPINIYWDNVGGESFDAALGNSAVGARHIICGTISDYNGASYHVKNLNLIFPRQLHLFGILHTPLHAKYHERFHKEVDPKIAAGLLKFHEDRTLGLEKAGEAILAVQKGTNKGKAVVVIAEQ